MSVIVYSKVSISVSPTAQCLNGGVVVIERVNVGAVRFPIERSVGAGDVDSRIRLRFHADDQRCVDAIEL